ncbi:MAG: VCBS repeat-containing protein [Bacteroidia bacterium]|nr:VCBS repeat-containing protein [Bacteroidia bacterium]
MKNIKIITALALLAVAFTSPEQTKAQAAVCFSNAANIYDGTFPLGAVSKDFNKDGKMDIAFVSHDVFNFADSGKVFVAFGNGLGGFSTPLNYSAGVKTYDILSDDFNNDGKYDLAITNFASNDISILLGDGLGVFAPAVNYGTGHHALSLSSSDFNSDGNVDLAIVDGDSMVTVLSGNGGGSFAVIGNYRIGNSPQKIISDDFNNDGKADLLATNHLSDNVSLLLGDGTGAFSSPVNFGPVYSPWQVTSGDFNTDGNKDIAIASYGGVGVDVFLGTGTGNFGSVASTYLGTSSLSITSADFNGDNKLDLAVARVGAQGTPRYADTLSVLLGDGTGAFFHYPQDVPRFSLGVGIPSDIVKADFNGDGSEDLLVANNYDLSVLLNCYAATGINDFASNNEVLSVSPNPLYEETVISFSNPENMIHSITIRDVTGRTVRRVDNISGTSVKLDRAELLSGIYFCELLNKTNRKRLVSKMVIE